MVAHGTTTVKPTQKRDSQYKGTQYNMVQPLRKQTHKMMTQYNHSLTTQKTDSQYNSTQRNHSLTNSENRLTK